MKTVFPVHLENGMVIYGNEQPFMISNDPDFKGVSGYDADENRATNIVGFDGRDLLKRCTNPDCLEIKPRAEGFGEKGRCTNPKTKMRRDQAQCKVCRSKKK
ncbi:MAG: hypothetical protein K6T66_15760 [Peptococcaceae bacterium]|nr:hypothetical protein [Peptococcaceae bacterium]